MILIFSLVFFLPETIAQNPLHKRIKLEIQNQSLEEVILKLQNTYGIAFSYSKDIVRLDRRISEKFYDRTIEEVLDGIFVNTNIVYSLKAGMIVLQPKPQNFDKVIIKGKVMNMESGLPIEFAGIQLINTVKGTLTDKNGNFSIQIQKSELNDSLVISSLGFEKASFIASGFTQSYEHVVYLKPKIVSLQTVNIRASDFKTKTLGNNSLFSFGSIYIDTQGQQTALFISNKRGKRGIISSVSYYLSGKGNVNSPFRIRIYEKDTMSVRPGKDLLTEMVVAKPKKAGWFKIDISQFNIDVPAEGFFVAIEGIYPAEQINGGTEDSDSPKVNYLPNTISYGQRLGYSKKKGFDTWHYSLAHTWFQLKEDNYHILISAEIQQRRRGKRKN
jgi:hypothetical protein